MHTDTHNTCTNFDGHRNQSLERVMRLPAKEATQIKEQTSQENQRLIYEIPHTDKEGKVITDKKRKGDADKGRKDPAKKKKT